MANVYPNVHESLKFLADEHVILEDPLNDKSTKDEPEKLNMEAEVVFMVTVPIYQASSSVPPLSTPVIDLSPPKHVPSTTQAPIVTTTTTTTTTTLLLLPSPQQQSTTDPELVTRVTTLEQKFSIFEQKSKTLDNTTQNPRSRVFTLKLRDLPYKINQTVNEVEKEVVHVALQAPLQDRFRELPEADMKEILHQRMFESGTYKSLPEHVALYEALEVSMERTNRDEFFAQKEKSRKRRRDDQDPPLPPPDSNPSKKRRHASNASGSTQSPAPQSSVEDVPIPDTVNVSDSEDIDTTHLPNIKTRPDWLKPVPEEDIPFIHQLVLQTDWKEETEQSRLRRPSFQVDLVNPEGHRVVPNVRKPLPLGGPPGQVTIQSQFFFNKDLEYLVSGDKGRRSALSISKLKASQYLDFGLEELVPSLWIESERDYDISAAYGISHWWFKRKEFYITRHSAPSDRSKVRSHMRILSVVSLKTFERYGYTFLKEIVLRRADYKEYKISEANFKNLHPNDFEDMYLLHLQGQLNYLSGADKVHLFNAVNLWIRNIVIRKRVEDLQLGIEKDYTIVSKPRALIYRDRNDQKKMMQETEVHKFSDGTLNRILDKLDHMVKDFKLFKFNSGMETRIWSEDDSRRSKDFMEVIERRLKIRRIFRSLKSFVGGRLRDVDYRLIKRTE
ncbi:hypothetical protein Tco_0312377 [Tanacetum coccineum]